MSASQVAAAPPGAAAVAPVRGFTPTDKVFLAFVAANTLVLLWHAGDVPSWPLLLLANLGAAGLVRLLTRAPLTGLTRFIGGAYPLMLTAGYYPQIGIINTGVGRVYDAIVQRWEVALFGSQISVTWHHTMPNPLLSELLHFCYGSFYLLVIFAPVFLFMRRSDEGFERGTFVITLVLYFCYFCFCVFPVAGPRYFFGEATGPEANVYIARLVDAVLQEGSAWGTAFPSSHVAAAWAAAYILWREAPKTALVVGPIAFGVAFGTVYGQFHYGTDAVSGALVAVALCILADPLRQWLRSGTVPGAARSG